MARTMRRGQITAALSAFATVAMLAFGASTAAAAGPRMTAGGPVRQLTARGPLATEFAFGAGRTFVSGVGATSNARGGVYLLRGGRLRLLPGSPKFVYGIAWRNGSLYIAGTWTLYRWSNFNGSRFTRRRTIYRAPTGFEQFNGLAFGANGRLYAGVGIYEDNDDNGPTSSPYARDILSFSTSGAGPEVFATGIRQPWQLAFPPGSNSPFVSDLGPDNIPSQPNPPDGILRVTAGQNYGFPTCDWSSASACGGFATPLKLLPPHTDPMGVATFKNRLYFTQYGVRAGARVSWILQSGGAVHQSVTGFDTYIVALGQNDGSIYVGEVTGQIYRFTPRRRRS
jgi:glucose/arabinose dehydrogenase